MQVEQFSQIWPYKNISNNEKNKLERELGPLSRSRRDYFHNEIANLTQEYEEKLKANVNVEEEHICDDKILLLANSF